MLTAKIPLEEIKEGLEHNLELVDKLNFIATDYATFLQACPFSDALFKDNFKEMEQFYWNVHNLCDIIYNRTNYNRTNEVQLLSIETGIVKEMRTGVTAFESWSDEELTFIQNFCYEKGVKAEKKEKHFFIGDYFVTLKKEIDTQREKWIKEILAFEWQLDAQIALQHTNEFSEVFSSLNNQQYENARLFLIGGYHAGGIISGNIMRQLKYFYKINFDGYVNLKDVCKN